MWHTAQAISTSRWCTQHVHVCTLHGLKARRSLMRRGFFSLSLVFSWTHSTRELRPSPRHAGTFDQPEAASAWLKSFRTLNSHFTAQVHDHRLLHTNTLPPLPPPPAQLRLTQDRVWGKKDHSSAGEEVNKVIDKVCCEAAVGSCIIHEA